MQFKNDTAAKKKRVELTLYVANKLKGAHCGAVKLNKLLFFADMLAYGTLGQSISGASYKRQPMGPVPGDMVELKKKLVKDAEAVERHVKSGGDHSEKRLFPLREADMTAFSSAELKIVDHVINRYGSWTGKQLSALSHEYAGWNLANTGEEIPMATIFMPKKPLQPTGAQQAWATSVLADLSA
jgi:uncharacterized phage-associated protein